MNLGAMLQDYLDTHRLDKPFYETGGCHGLVVPFCEKYVGKVFWPRRSTKLGYSSNQLAHKEFSVGSFLYNNDVSVPSYYDVAEVRAEHYTADITEPTLAVIMDNIPGRELWKLATSASKMPPRIRAMWRSELDKVAGLGVVLGDDGSWNALYWEKTDRVYLIDFANSRWPAHNSWLAEPERKP